MRASRLVQVLLLLQARGQMTARQLAAELEVSVRTIFRDLEALSGAGVPVYAERGADGGFRLLDGYRTTLTGLTTKEAEALFLTGLPGPAGELGLATAVAAARRKVLAALPAGLQEAAAVAQERIHLDPAGWFRTPPEHPHLETVASAVWGAKRLSIVYQRPDGKTVERALAPLGLVLKEGAWYLVAEISDDRRVYRVSRIVQAEVGRGTFTRPGDFDLPHFWSEWVTEFESSLDAYPVTVRIAPDALTRLARFADALTRAADAPPPRLDAEGWTVRVLVFEHVGQARDALLSFGPGIEALEPAELRGALEHAVRELARTYAIA